jgi:hypothetical protein
MRITLVIEDTMEKGVASVKIESHTNPPHKSLAPEQLEASPAFGLFCVVGNLIADQMKQDQTISEVTNSTNPVEEKK